MDSFRSRLITASRDRTLIVWSLNSEAGVSPRLATLVGHRASVLCFKFDKDFLISCGSDHVLLVWDLSGLPSDGQEEDDEDEERVAKIIRPVKELRGHSGGVLDLKMDDDIIISW